MATSVTALTLVFGSLSAYTIARQRFRWTLFLLQANIVARFVPVIVLMIPLYVVMRSFGQLNSLSGVIIAETGFLLPYAHPDPGALLRHHSDRAGGGRAHRRLHAVRRLPAHRRCRWRRRRWRRAASSCSSSPGTSCLIPLILNTRPEFMTLPVVIASLVGDVMSSSI